MLPPTDDTLRAESCLHVPGWEGASVRLDLIVKGGSDRYYYRATAAGLDGEGPETAIIMVYTDRRPDNLSFFAATEVLALSGARTMRVYHHDEARRIGWLEDLGKEDLWECREAGDAMPLYRDTLTQVAHLHRMRAADLPESLRETLQPAFDVRLYRWEQDYFFNQFAARFSVLPEEALTALRESSPFAEMAETLASLPRTLVHRDFQSQNVIRSGDQAFLIDYQGVREGRPEYDLASLLYDPYVSLTAAERRDLLAHYQSVRADLDGGTVDAEVLRMAACQRLMQALGAYAKLGAGDGKLSFLRHIPPAVENLRGVLAETGLLPGLAEALELRQGAADSSDSP
ncbi:MAG: phosphotransferase [Verrucomicrobiota bacterium]